MIHPLVHELITVFLVHADTVTSARKRAYMKHRYDFFGIFQPKRVALQKIVFKKHAITTVNELSVIVTELWNQKNRECLYAATDLLQEYKRLWTHDIIALFEYCLTTHAWWDSVDDLAVNCIGKLCTQYPTIMHMMDTWIDHENMWLRRTALIFQLKYKAKTDTERLFTYCTKRMHEKEFFIRKAIGWTLREYSKTDHTAVAQFVITYTASLSPLSKREASKYL